MGPWVRISAGRCEARQAAGRAALGAPTFEQTEAIVPGSNAVSLSPRFRLHHAARGALQHAPPLNVPTTYQSSDGPDSAKNDQHQPKGPGAREQGVLGFSGVAPAGSSPIGFKFSAIHGIDLEH